MAYSTSPSFFTWRLKSFSDWCSGSGGFSWLIRALLALRGYWISWWFWRFLQYHYKKEAAALLIDRSVGHGRGLSLFLTRDIASGPDAVLTYTEIHTVLIHWICSIYTEPAERDSYSHLTSFLFTVVVIRPDFSSPWTWESLNII